MFSINSKFIVLLFVVNLEVGYVFNVILFLESVSLFKVKYSVFSNKVFLNIEIKIEIKIVGFVKNVFGVKEYDILVMIEVFLFEIFLGNVEVVLVDKVIDKIIIVDVEIVVFGGRGLKGLENWGMIEELVSVLGVVIVCLKFVSDMGWRFYSEYVG